MKQNKFFKKLSAMAMTAVLAAGLLVGTAAAADLPDPTRKCSITVHKYGTASSSQTPGDGLQLSGADAAKLGTPLEGVGFTLYKVNPTYTVGKSTTPAQALANSTAVGPEKLTNASGELNWTTLDQGYYVLSETTPKNGFDKAVDSIITLPYGYTATGTGFNYDVHVYPKNVNSQPISKEVDKTKIYNVGDTVTWTIYGKVQASLRSAAAPYTYGKYQIDDALDSRLTYTDGSEKLTMMGGSKGNVDLLPADYTVDKTTTPGTVSWVLTNAGIDKVAGDGATSIRVVFNTTINPTATGGSPSITNGATMKWINDTGAPGTAAVPADMMPTISLASIFITKVDSKVSTLDLQGAKFKVASSEINAQSGTYMKNSANVDLIVETGDNPATPAVEKGWANFTGLPLTPGVINEYFLVETKAPTGYLLQQTTFRVTFGVNEKVANVTVLNQKVGDDPIDPNKPTFTLPLTGGTGSILFTIVGILVMAGAGFAIFKSRKRVK